MTRNAKTSYGRPSIASGLSLALLAWITIVMVFVVGPVRAAVREHPYLPSLSQVDEYPVEEPCGDATDSLGDYYVTERVGRFYVYDSSGQLLTHVNTSSDIIFPCSIAVDSAGDVYAISREVSVGKYVPSEFPPTERTTYSLAGVIDKTEPQSGAVDSVTQNVYVAEVIKTEGLSLGRIVEYEPDGKKIGEPVGVGVVPGARYSSIGVDGATGDIYAVDEVHNKVYVFSSKGEILTTINGDKVPGCSAEEEVKEECFGSLEKAHLAVEQSTGDVYVDDIFSHEVVDQFEASGGYVAQIGPAFGGSLHFVDPSRFQAAIAVDDGASSPNDGDVYVVSQSKEGKAASLYAFGPLTAAVSYGLNVVKSGGGMGVVADSLTGIDCGAVCSHEYNEGSRVVLTETPVAGSVFAGWSGCEAEPVVGRCEVTMSGARSVGASFVRAFVLTVDEHGGGVVSSEPGGIYCGGVCSSRYGEGARVVLTAAAGAGSVFRGWSGGGCAGTGVCEVTLDEAVTVEAAFVGDGQSVLAGPGPIVPVFSFDERPPIVVKQPPPTGSGVARVRVLTRAQKLAAVLRTCGKKSKSKRASCVKQARRRYGSVQKKAKQ